jgi:hypothetical protein
MKGIRRLALVACCVIGLVVAGAPSASARLAASDPDDVRFHLDIRSVAARGSDGRFRIHVGFYEPIPWDKGVAVWVHLNTQARKAFDYNLMISRRPGHRRCELQMYDRPSGVIRARTHFSAHGGSVSCSVPRRQLRPDRQLQWVVSDYLLDAGGFGRQDRAPDTGVYPHA